jgi:erythromycin esterase-like protein
LLGSYNKGKGPADKQIGFYGFDMQYPGIAIDSVLSYTSRAMPGLGAELAGHYSCLDEYRNDARGRSAKNYSSAPASVTSSCSAEVAAAYQSLLDRRTTLEPATSAPEYALAVQMARVVGAVGGNETRRDAARRRHGRERGVAATKSRGTEWQIVPVGTQLSHFPRTTGWNHGSYLARTYREAYVPIGFTFGSGAFNAVVDGGLNGTRAPAPSIGSYEEVFQYARNRNFFVTMMEVPAGDVAFWFAGRSACARSARSTLPRNPRITTTRRIHERSSTRLIYIHSTTASQLLPFIY